MTEPEIRALIRGIAPAIKTYVREHIQAEIAEVIVAGIKAGTAPLEKRIAELEARTVVKTAAAWRSGNVYREGEIVTHRGSAWICIETHSAGGAEPSHKYFRRR